MRKWIQNKPLSDGTAAAGVDTALFWTTGACWLGTSSETGFVSFGGEAVFINKLIFF